MSSMGDYFEAEISAFTDQRVEESVFGMFGRSNDGGRVTCHWPWMLEYCIAIGKSLQIVLRATE